MEDKEVITIIDNRLIMEAEPINKYPVVRPDKYITLYVNGEKTKGPIIISNEKEIIIEIAKAKQDNLIEIEVTEDRLKAYLRINQQERKRLRPNLVKDPSRIGDFVITTKEETVTKQHKVTLEEVYKKLGELGIKYGLNEAAITQAIENPGERILIAEGIAPVCCIDEEIEYLFSQKEADPQQENLAELASSAEKIDFFGYRKTCSVKIGQILAVKKPARSGKPGIDIFGEVIPVREPQVIEWKIGNGVTIINNKAVAIVPGRPVIDKGKLAVFNIYEVENDVDFTVGSIDFNGDVVINGDVCDKFSVKATGNIKVGRNTSNAYVEAGGSILVGGNIISSKIISGGASAYQQGLEKGLKSLFKIFSEVEQAAAGLKKEKLFKNLSERELIFGLLETKYKNATEIIRELIEAQKSIGFNEEKPELVSVVNELSIFLDSTNQRIDLKQFVIITRKVGRLWSFYNKIDNPEASIYTNYIQNSFVKATGDIIIRGKGAYNSTLEAGGKVVITGIPGVFRGGRIKSGKGVVVRELGSVGGSRVDIQVDEGGKITAGIVYDNVFINIGGRQLKLDKEMRNINARLDYNGQIVF